MPVLKIYIHFVKVVIDIHSFTIIYNIYGSILRYYFSDMLIPKFIILHAKVYYNKGEIFDQSYLFLLI